MSWLLSLLLNASTIAAFIAKQPAKTLCYAGGLILILVGLLFHSIATVILGGAIVFIGTTYQRGPIDAS